MVAVVVENDREAVVEQDGVLRHLSCPRVQDPPTRSYSRLAEHRPNDTVSGRSGFKAGPDLAAIQCSAVLFVSSDHPINTTIRFMRKDLTKHWSPTGRSAWRRSSGRGTSDSRESSRNHPGALGGDPAHAAAREEAKPSRPKSRPGPEAGRSRGASRVGVDLLRGTGLPMTVLI